MSGSGWDDTALNFSKEKYLLGWTFGAVTRALAAQGYIFSRSAVIGKINREKTNNKEFRDAAPKVVIKDKGGRAPKSPIVRSLRGIDDAAPPKRPKPAIVTPDKEKDIQYIGPIGAMPAWGLCQFTRDDIQKHDVEGKPIWQTCGHPAIVKGKGRNTVQSPWCAAHSRICCQQLQGGRGKNAA